MPPAYFYLESKYVNGPWEDSHGHSCQRHCAVSKDALVELVEAKA